MVNTYSSITVQSYGIEPPVLVDLMAPDSGCRLIKYSGSVGSVGSVGAVRIKVYDSSYLATYFYYQARDWAAGYETYSLWTIGEMLLGIRTRIQERLLGMPELYWKSADAMITRPEKSSLYVVNATLGIDKKDIGGWCAPLVAMLLQPLSDHRIVVKVLPEPEV